MDNLLDPSPARTRGEEVEVEGETKGSAARREEPTTGQENRGTAEGYRLQIIIELLRQHIIKTTSSSTVKRDAKTTSDVRQEGFLKESGFSGEKHNHSQRKRRQKQHMVPKVESLFDASISLQQHQRGREEEEEADFLRHEEGCEDEEGKQIMLWHRDRGMVSARSY